MKRQKMLNHVLRQGFSEKHNKTSFGFKEVKEGQKQGLVNSVFTSVSDKYDIMNDVMSGGVHRLWKNHLISDIGILVPQGPGQDRVEILDVAAGTGDISYKLIAHQQQYWNSPEELHNRLGVTLLDINESILQEAKNKAASLGIDSRLVNFQLSNAENLEAIPDNSKDLYVISFGLRNVPDTKKALSEAFRVLKPGGRFVCMEFSKVENSVLAEVYRQYSFNAIPLMGQIITGDRESYQYLVESIEKFYNQSELLTLIKEAGFEYATYENLSFGAVAIHSGFKLKNQSD